jgi:CHAD domain-containing protein
VTSTTDSHTELWPTSVRFFAGESLSEGLARVIQAQFDIALQIATADPEEQAAAVHETRKAIKRLRAMLRMVRGSISLDRYHTDNAMLKLIAAELGAVRDAWVMAEILERLLPHEGDTSGIIPVLIDRLQQRYRIESAAVLENKALMASIVEQLEHVRDSSARWTILAGEQSEPLPHRFDAIAPGLQRVYKRGRRGMRIVAGSPTDTLLHVWRKRAKYLRHQVEALNILDPARLAGYEASLERLTDALGDDHDLAILLSRLDDDAALTADLDIAGVLDLIYTERHDLQAEAIAIGEQFFEDPSTDFLVYMESVWKEGSTF